MDMTELKRAPASISHSVPQDAPVAEDRWRDVMSEMSAEIASPLTAALERVQMLATTGRIDRSSLRALGEEIQQARQIGMSGQQIARLASGKLRQTHERLPLAETLKDVLTQRARDTQAANIHIKQVMRPAEVIVDASLLFALLNTTLSWSLAHARTSIEFRIDIKAWPTHARMTARFAC
jgi:K+-sensing histidine kinase KdpD